MKDGAEACYDLWDIDDTIEIVQLDMKRTSISSESQNIHGEQFCSIDFN